MGVGLRLILALVLGMSLVMFLIMKTKIQAFEGGVGGGDVNGVRRGRPQDVLDGVVQTGSVRGVVRVHRHLIGRIRADVPVELDVGRVDRIGGRVDEIDPAVGDAAEIAVLVALDGHGRGGIVAVGQGIALLQGRDEREGRVPLRGLALKMEWKTGILCCRNARFGPF